MTVIAGPLAYFPLPKAANTSVKLALYELAFGRPYGVAAGLPANIHHYEPWRTAPFGPQSLAATEGLLRFSVVRDPIDRLLSAYVHRVLMRDAVSEEKLARRGAGLPAEPDLSTFVDNLETYRELSRGVRHHTAPLVEFLGPDPAVYARLFGIGDMGRLQAWLSEVAGRDIVIPHRMASDRDKAREELTPAQVARLRAFYSDDYRFLEQAGLA